MAAIPVPRTFLNLLSLMACLLRLLGSFALMLNCVNSVLDYSLKILLVDIIVYDHGLPSTPGTFCFLLIPFVSAVSQGISLFCYLGIS